MSPAKMECSVNHGDIIIPIIILTCSLQKAEIFALTVKMCFLSFPHNRWNVKLRASVAKISGGGKQNKQTKKTNSTTQKPQYNYYGPNPWRETSWHQCDLQPQWYDSEPDVSCLKSLSFILKQSRIFLYSFTKYL